MHATVSACYDKCWLPGDGVLLGGDGGANRNSGCAGRLL